MFSKTFIVLFHSYLFSSISIWFMYHAICFANTIWLWFLLTLLDTSAQSFLLYFELSFTNHSLHSEMLLGHFLSMYWLYKGVLWFINNHIVYLLMLSCCSVFALEYQDLSLMIYIIFMYILMHMYKYAYIISVRLIT